MGDVIPMTRPQPPAPPTFRPLMQGMSGDVIAALQERLCAWGFYSGDVDGVFGPYVVEAVRGLQCKLGLEPTGVFDERTAQAVKADLDAQEKSKLQANERRLALPEGDASKMTLSPSSAGGGASAASATAKAESTTPGAPTKKTNPLWWLLGAGALVVLVARMAGDGSLSGFDEPAPDNYLDHEEPPHEEPQEQPQQVQ